MAIRSSPQVQWRGRTQSNANNPPNTTPTTPSAPNSSQTPSTTTTPSAAPSRPSVASSTLSRHSTLLNGAHAASSSTSSSSSASSSSSPSSLALPAASSLSPSAPMTPRTAAFHRAQTRQPSIMGLSNVTVAGGPPSGLSVAAMPATVRKSRRRSSVVHDDLSDVSALSADGPSLMPESPASSQPFIPNPPELDGVPDMSQLIYLEEPHVVHNLRVRYSKDEIYTNIANILVAINPYKSIPIYGPEFIAMYAGVKQSLFHKLPPHVYAVSESSYKNLVFNGANQSVIVCGESGSGKTESAKLLMRHLAYTTQEKSVAELGNLENKDDASDAYVVEQQVLAANPILESFGNAKTTLNNNSSRFGKFTKLLFSKTGSGAGPSRILGSFIETYLLEKSRVVRQITGERNYHIFYQIIKGVPADERYVKYQLQEPEQYYYLNQSNCVEIASVSDHGRFTELCKAMSTLGIKQPLQEEIFRIMAGILHLGNVRFVEDQKSSARIVDFATLEDRAQLPPSVNADLDPANARTPAAGRRGQRKSSVIVGSDLGGAVAIAAQLLGVDVSLLEKRLLTRSIKVGGETISTPLSPLEAEFNRDAMTKALYSAMFQWVVARINRELFGYGSSNDDQKAGTQPSMNPEAVDISGMVWIGILDVFGFECFENNSFEQFCINFANERLQQYFNHHVIKSEQLEYQREAVFWVPITIPDNNDTIDLIDSKPQGMFALLDSVCITPKGSDEMFTQQLFSSHKKHARLRQVTAVKAKPNSGAQSNRGALAMNGFAVCHYAGEVMYNAHGFLVKNADSTHDDTISLFCSSTQPLTASLLQDLREMANRKRFRSISSVFSSQLASLLKQLQSTSPYFVRCVNPNAHKTPGFFDDHHVTKQLRCGGLIEALRILKLGYPTRAPYAQIRSRYGHLLSTAGLSDDVNERDLVEALLFAFDLRKEDYQLGLTKVFFKPNKQEFMEKILKSDQQTLPPELIAKVKRYLVRKKLVRVKGVIKAYSRWFLRLRRMRAKKAFQCAVAIARVIAGSVIRRLRASRALCATVTVQACLRAAGAVRGLRLLVSKIDASRFIFAWWQRNRFRQRLVREIDKRISAKRTEAEKERERQRQREKEAELQRAREEKAARAAAARYFSSPPSSPYDESLVPFVEEVGQWIAQSNGESIEGDLFDALRDGIALAVLSAKLAPKAGVRVNRQAKPNSFFAKEHMTKFLSVAQLLGVPAVQLCPQADLLNMDHHRPVLNCLLNFALMACTRQPDLCAKPASGGILLEEMQELKEDATKAAKAARSGVDFFSPERLAASAAPIPTTPIAEPMVATAVPLMNFLTPPSPRHGPVHPPGPGLHRRPSVMQQNEDFFSMTTAAILRSLEEEGLLQPKDWAAFSVPDMYNEARTQSVPWHKWHYWVKNQILEKMEAMGIKTNLRVQTQTDRELKLREEVESSNPAISPKLRIGSFSTIAEVDEPGSSGSTNSAASSRKSSKKNFPRSNSERSSSERERNGRAGNTLRIESDGDDTSSNATDDTMNTDTTLDSSAMDDDASSGDNDSDVSDEMEDLPARTLKKAKADNLPTRSPVTVITRSSITPKPGSKPSSNPNSTPSSKSSSARASPIPVRPISQSVVNPPRSSPPIGLLRSLTVVDYPHMVVELDPSSNTASDPTASRVPSHSPPPPDLNMSTPARLVHSASVSELLEATALATVSAVAPTMAATPYSLLLYTVWLAALSIMNLISASSYIGTFAYNALPGCIYAILFIWHVTAIYHGSYQFLTASAIGRVISGLFYALLVMLAEPERDEGTWFLVVAVIDLGSAVWSVFEVGTFSSDSASSHLFNRFNPSHNRVVSLRVYFAAWFSLLGLVLLLSPDSLLLPMQMPSFATATPYWLVDSASVYALGPVHLSGILLLVLAVYNLFVANREIEEMLDAAVSGSLLMLALVVALVLRDHAPFLVLSAPLLDVIGSVLLHFHRNHGGPQQVAIEVLNTSVTPAKQRTSLERRGGGGKAKQN